MKKSVLKILKKTLHYILLTFEGLIHFIMSILNGLLMFFTIVAFIMIFAVGGKDMVVFFITMLVLNVLGHAFIEKYMDIVIALDRD